MPVNTKAVKQRIVSAKNTKKITKAMELVSAAKMRKAVDSATGTRAYSKYMHEVLVHLSHIDEPNVPLLEVRPVENVLVIMISSNRGLCGSYNSNLFKSVHNLLQNKDELTTVVDRDGETISGSKNAKIDIVGIGKRVTGFAKKFDYNLSAVFDDISEKPGFLDILPITKMIVDGYLEKKYDKVLIGYTHFTSSLSQTAKVEQLLPLLPEDLAPKDEKEEKEMEEINIANWLLEPNIDEIVETIIPKLIEVKVYQSLLESRASEHSSRMVAMKNASENANELIDDLTLEFNKARQAAITQEIAEIASGAQALA